MSARNHIQIYAVLYQDTKRKIVPLIQKKRKPT